MPNSIPDPLRYYARPGLMTDAKEYDGLLEGLPTEISALRDTESAFALNEHPRIVGPHKYRYHSPFISVKWCAFTNYS